MKQPQSDGETDLLIEFDMRSDLPLQATELTLVQELLPELLKDVLRLQSDEE